MRAAGRQASVPYLTALILPVLLLTACGTELVFLGDPVLAAIEGDGGVLERELREAARRSGRRLSVEWDTSEQIGTEWLESRLAEHGGRTVVLSPLFSVFADELARVNPQTELVAFYGTSGTTGNLVRVSFDRTEAMRELGTMVARWEAAAGGAAAGLFLANDSSRRLARDALLDGYESIAGAVLHFESFAAPPDRDTVRAAVRAMRAAGVSTFALFLGDSNTFALDQLRVEPVAIATDHLRSGGYLLASVIDPLDRGMVEALESESGVVTVSSIVIPGPLLRTGQ